MIALLGSELRRAIEAMQEPVVDEVLLEADDVAAAAWSEGD